MAGDVYVSFGAETDELEAAFAVAKAETAALAKEMRTLAAEMAASGAAMDSELGEQLLATAAKMSAAKAEMASLKGELSEKTGEEGGFLKGVAEKAAAAVAPLTSLKASLGEIMEIMVAAFAVEAIGEFIEHMAQLGSQTVIAATVLGTTVDQIAALRLVAKTSGIGLDELQNSFAKLSRNITDESPNSKRALDALGLSFSDLRGKEADEQLGTLAESFSKIENGATKDAIAMELFGRAGVQMLPMLNEGKVAIEEMANAAAEAGTALNEETVAGMEAAHRSMTTLTEAMSGAGIAVWNEFRSVLLGAVQYLTDLTEEFTSAAKQSGVVHAALDDLRASFQILESLIVGITKLFQEVWNVASSAVNAIDDAFHQMGKVIADVFNAIAGGIGQFFSGLITAATNAAHVVGQEFVNLGAVISNGITGHFGEASAAFGKMGTDATAAGASIKNAFSGALAGFDFSKVESDMQGAVGRQSAILQLGVEDAQRIADQGQSEIDAIWRESYAKQEGEAEKHEAHMAAIKKAGADKAAKDALKAAMERFDGEARAAQDAEKLRATILNNELQQHRISTDQWLAQTKDALQDELQDQLAAYNQELQLANLTMAQKQAILNKMQEAQAKYDQAIVAAEQKAADETSKSWESAANTIESAFNSQLRGLLEGTTSWKQAMSKIFEDLVIKVIEYGEKMVVQWVLNEITKTTATEAGVAAREGAEAAGAGAGLATQAAAILKSIFSSGAETFAGVFGFLSPIMGPAAAGPAAASEATVIGAAGAVASADIGMWNVPSDQLTMIHKNELVMPAAQAAEFRRMLSNTGGASGTPGTNANGGTPVNIHFNGPVYDATKLAATVRDMFNKNPSLRPKLT